MITKEMVEQRLARLHAEQLAIREKHELLSAEVIRLKSTYEAYSGAIQECTFWLRTFDAAETKDLK